MDSKKVRAVELLGGGIEVVSEWGKGTCVKIVLPRRSSV